MLLSIIAESVGFSLEEDHFLFRALLPCSWAKSQLIDFAGVSINLIFDLHTIILNQENSKDPGIHLKHNYKF